jgi:hypothetical protein
MNHATTISLPLGQYYSFVNDVCADPSLNQTPINHIFAKAIVELAKSHPSAYQELSWRDKWHLRHVPSSNKAYLTIGEDAVNALESLTKLNETEVSYAARALMKEYAVLDVKQKESLLQKSVD